MTMSTTGKQFTKLGPVEQLLAPFLVLLIGKLTGFNPPPTGGGDPVFLTDDQAAAVAAEGIGLLAPYLPQEAAQRITSTIAAVFDGTAGGSSTGGGAQGSGRVGTIPRLQFASTDQILLNMGEIDHPTIVPEDREEGPGCCVGSQHGLVCVRVARGPRPLAT
jgi:hypothetical protein